MPASHPLSWRRSSAERGKGFDGATRCNTCGPMETQLAAYWLASGDLYLFRRLSEDLALASTVLVLRGAYLTQNLKYFDAILIKFLRMLNASKCKVFRFKIREKVFWANVASLAAMTSRSASTDALLGGRPRQGVAEELQRTLAFQ